MKTTVSNFDTLASVNNERGSPVAPGEVGEIVVSGLAGPRVLR
jgi:hypothetical protein